MRRYSRSYGKGWKPYEGEYKVIKLNTYKNEETINFKEAEQFYLSEEWKQCRKEFYANVKEYKCVNCGWKKGDSKRKYLCVDHILPVRKFWEKRLLQSNLQLLCNECNKEKGNEYDVTKDDENCE